MVIRHSKVEERSVPNDEVFRRQANGIRSIYYEMPSSRIELETFGCQSCYQECHIKGYETDVMTKLDHEGYH
ncbi:hypothetical protein N7455_002833 [Penicillium solitum]|uniref:uncharacterized protein n=1 Tax=Penicillium solitum TaxID=60172 RepID=UPI0032C3F597|nr:hypothetical protein N7455_002833 [Penicillium solitum]